MFVLIHGAYHGGWCWNEVVQQLSDDDIAVTAPDLPGHGTDEGWLADQTLESYVQRIVEIVQTATTPVTLVAHSMAGAIAVLVENRLPDRIARIIFLTAYIPKDGETLGDLVAADPESYARIDRVDIEGINAICLKKGTLPDAFYNMASDKATAYAEDRVQLQSPVPFRDIVQLSDPSRSSVALSAILCTQDRAISVDHQRWMAERANCTPVIELEADHSPFLSNPTKLVEAIRQIAV